ncbi:PREDICTED: E3 ubiquitin-protein ligase MIB2-like isoform X3 [Acropora digitifera]|uniref:E3 ubiquitin-protein ligase MIB2-like isoform X3 n=1 Tax=Acropora digitifera TaxID=70779 RepID=UPI00077A6877|nr:PREDICTED: E3 ubiquitin-protein ligase MIB2-like isoform X3 [Acropora digitifera]
MEFLGVRVVRGPDWEWSNQDGGEGSVGTVVQIGSDTKSAITEPIVLVQWDCGRKATYRAGMDGKYDLRILDTANGGERHLCITCDGCQRSPIIGSRWHCKTCPNYDLCTLCYMTDFHNKGHTFERIDKSRGKGVDVGTRRESTKLEARGLFKGAKVIRVPDCEVNDQGADPNVVGVVEEVVSSSDEDTNGSVRVSWKKGGQTYIYRVGKDGKVDLKCTVPATGRSYYRDHLPLLVFKQKKSQSGFTTGEKVIVELTCKQLEESSSGHGEWNADMAKFIGKVGLVQDFTSSGDVVVEYPEKRWRYNPKALTKVQQIKRGDEVLVKTDKDLVEGLQVDHGGWNEAMVSILGRIAKVLDVDGNGDLVVLVEGDRWLLNPAAVTRVTDPEVVHGRNDSDHASEIPLVHQLFRDFLQQTGVADLGSQELIVACRQNMLSRVREILDNNPELIDAMAGGHTALHIACHEGHCNIIRELIDSGADKDKVDLQGYTAIHHAAYGDKTGEALKFLLSKGFDPNVQGREHGGSPLHLAVKKNNEMAVRILTQHATCDVNLKDQEGNTPLHCAIAGEEHNMVDMLVNNTRLMAAITNHKGFNYLQFAVLKGNKPAVEKLVEKYGSTLNVAKDDGFTTLHIAAINGYREIAKILLEQPCCSVNAVAIENQTPLHLAAEEGYPDMVEVLLDHGAHVNAANDDGDTPLHLSLKKELMFKNSEMQPALHMFLALRGRGSRGNAAVSRCLLNYGADVRRRNNTNETPLDSCGGTEVEQVIRHIAATGNSKATKVPTFGGATSHPGFAHQGGNCSTEADKHGEAVDHSNDTETNKNRRSSNDEGGHGQDSDEKMNKSQEEEVLQDEEQSEDAIVQNDFAQTSMPLIQIKQFKRGDEVLVKTDKNLVEELQIDHGGWYEAMISILGRIGNVLDVDGNGDLVVLIEGERWLLNPAAVTYVTDPEIVPGKSDSDHASEIPTDFFRHLMRAFLHQNLVADMASKQLFIACKQNMISRVCEILDNNPALIDTMLGGHTALHVACHEGHCNIIRELIERGADEDKLDDEGYTVIHHAAYGDKTGEALKLLLNKGFDPNVQDSENRNSPLHLAVQQSNEMAVRILTQDATCDVNLQDHDGNTALHCAVAGEKQNMVEMLLNNPRLSLTITNHEDFNYLQFAVLKGNKPAVEKLLEITGSTLNVAKDDGYATLHIAAVNGYGEIAKILLEQPGCCVNAVAEAKETPLHLAADRGYTDMAEVLLDHGADVNAADCDGDTPLHLSLQRQAVFKNPMQSALHMLLGLRGLGRQRGGYAAVSRCLLSYGADVRRRNNSGETPLDRCRGTEVEQVIQDIAAKGRSNAPKVPTFGAAASHPGFAQQGDNDSTEVAKHFLALDHSHGRETKENKSNSNDEKGHRQAAGEIVNDSHEEDRQDEGQMEDVLVKNEFVQNFKPLIQNVFSEAANQVLDTPLEEISNAKLNTAGVAMNDGAAASAENSDLTNEKNNKLSKKRPNETSKIIELQNGDSEMVDLRDERNAPEEQEPKRQKLICRICEENEALVAFKPCGHIILCSECAPRLKHCLECQTRILEKATRDGIPVISVNNKSLLTKYHTLEGKMRKLEESIECCICTTRKKNVVFLCGHGSCQYCADQLKTCHICQKEITRKIQIF